MELQKIYNLPARAHLMLVAALGTVLFIPFLGAAHLFDWDEINFAECAREMIVTGDYSNVKINFQPFWEKPPLFIWMQAICMKLFGVNEFAARLPDALCGIATLSVLYLIGSKTHGKKFGLLWAFAYAGSFLSHVYFKTGIIDPWFNLFIFLGIYQAILHTNSPSGSYGYKTAGLSAFFIGLATLTKGPAALLIFGLCAFIYWAGKKFAPVTHFKHLAIFAGVFILTAGSWFLYEFLSGDSQVIKDFFVYQVRLFNTKDSGHGGFFGYHFVVLLVGCFPASVFMIAGLKKSYSDTPFQKHFKGWMIKLFWVVLILFSIVETKIVHYSSLCWFPLSWMAAYGILKLGQRELKWKRWMTLLFFGLGTLLAFVFTLVPLIDFYKPWLLRSGIIADRFAADGLNVDAGWGHWEWIFGLLFLCAMIFIGRKLSKGEVHFAVPMFFLVMSSIFFMMIFITPRIEKYTQGPAIEFYEKVKGEKCYVETYGHKSFAPLFYSQKMPWHISEDQLEYVRGRMESDAKTGKDIHLFSQYAVEWMLSRPIDRPAYFVVKSPDAVDFQKSHPEFARLYGKGGFVFFRRNP